MGKNTVKRREKEELDGRKREKQRREGRLEIQTTERIKEM